MAGNSFINRIFGDVQFAFCSNVGGLFCNSGFQHCFLARFSQASERYLTYAQSKKSNIRCLFVKHDIDVRDGCKKARWREISWAVQQLRAMAF